MVRSETSVDCGRPSDNVLWVGCFGSTSTSTISGARIPVATRPDSLVGWIIFMQCTSESLQGRLSLSLATPMRVAWLIRGPPTTATASDRYRLSFP